MEAVMEVVVVSEPEPSGMRKVRTAAHGGEMHPATHAADMHPTSHAADMHPASHAADMHPASHATAMATAAAATAASECRWRQSKRRTERARDQATQELVVHSNPPWLNSFNGYRRKKTTSKPN
jgi:hypothetical protein